MNCSTRKKDAGIDKQNRVLRGKNSLAENLAMSDTEAVYFWEHPEARARLLALQSSNPSADDSASDSSSDSEVVVKRVNECLVSSTKSTWARDELYSRRLRARDWRQKFDRIDASGVGDHRC
jgi:hypothetical protein